MAHVVSSTVLPLEKFVNFYNLHQQNKIVLAVKFVPFFSKIKSTLAYAALLSLQHTIHHLLNSPDRVPIFPPSRNLLVSAYNEAQFLQKLIQKLDASNSFTEEANADNLLEFQDLVESNALSTKALPRFRMGRFQQVNALDEKMREAATKLEDALEMHVVNVILNSQSDDQKNQPSSNIVLDVLRELKQDVDSFAETARSLKEECINELFRNPLPEEKDNDDDIDDVASRIDFRGKKSKMVGFSDVFNQMGLYLVPSEGSESTIGIVSLVGMAGIGKTTLANEAFEDPSISSRFDHCAWVTVGPEYRLKDILQCILSQVYPDTDRMLTEEDDKYLLAQHFYEHLGFERYLIVLDDVWDEHIFRYLLGSFPYGCDGIRNNYRILILVTSRLQEVGSWAEARMLKLRFLNIEESWDLLREKVFGDGSSCSSELEKVGKKIAENCDGLPLAVVTVADFLSKADKVVEYWNKVAERKNSVFTDAYDRMSNVLKPSYEYLPQHWKACFLYMAVFPQNYEIPVPSLSMLWIAEGFHKSNPLKFLKEFAVEYLDELVGKSLVLARQRTHKNILKTCGLHSVFWHFCMKEAERNKFLHVLNSYADSVAQGMKSQRRLCVHKHCCIYCFEFNAGIDYTLKNNK